MKTIKYGLLAASLAILSVNAIAQKPQGDKPKPPAFSEMDANGDKSVTLAEFSALELPQGNASEIFGHIDSNKDGVLSEQEVTSFKPPRPPKK
jgi:hypothetical protein